MRSSIFRHVTLMTAIAVAVPLFASNERHRKLVAERERRIAAVRPVAEKKVAELVAAIDRSGETTVREVGAEELSTSVIFRFQQLHHGVPVEAAVAVIDVYKGVARSDSQFVADLNVNPVPNVTQRQAERIALEHLKVRNPTAVDMDTRLEIVPKFGEVVDRLVWVIPLLVELPDHDISRTIWIDAHSGEVVGDESNAVELTHVVTQPSLRGMYSRGWSFAVARLDSKTFEIDTVSMLADPCFGTGVLLGPENRCSSWQTFGHSQFPVANGVGNYVADAGGTSKKNAKPIRFVTSVELGDGVPGSTNFRTVAADAHLHMFQVFEYVRSRFGHEGLDATNGPQVHAMVRTSLSNSSVWDAQSNAIFIGSANVQYFDLASLDVIAHELGHAFDQYGPKLMSMKKGQPLLREAPKIGEATSDMLAMLVSSAGGDPVPHWIGEATIRANYTGTTFTNEAGLAFRYMDDPQKHPGDVACYYRDIRQLENHRGAGPANHMFYLLVHGGVSKCNGNVVEGIGLSNAGRIYWDAFRSLNSEATYATLRSAFIENAKKLFPGPNPIILSTAAAFDAVNVH